MKQRYLLAFALLFLSCFCPLFGQDTLSFGGIYELPGAEVRATYTPVSPLAQSFTIEEVYRLPGTFYDPARLVALLPGVVQTNDQANSLNVRGNTPNANLWRLNGLAIVNPNHTANAGTFYDFPTLSGGGVNAISAQMLDNSGFLAGGLPVEYGFATGGTFDLRLRPGSKTRRKYQAQAGFIGLDLMAEGPIGSSGQTSYLVNGRYSFTGLLADMGVDFGGEEIRFADLNAHLHHQWDGGEVSLFSIVGGSSNDFAGPDPDDPEADPIEEQKDLFDINFSSRLLVMGGNLSVRAARGTLKTGLSFSSTNPSRSQDFSAGRRLQFQGLDNAQINGNLSYTQAIGDGSEFQVGAELLYQGTEYTNLFAGNGMESDVFQVSSPEVRVASPFLSYRLIKGNSDLDLGVRLGTYFSDDLEDLTFEPRLRYVYKTGGQRFIASAERVSRPAISSLFLLDRSALASFAPVSDQFNLGYGKKFGGMNTQLTFFFQQTAKEYAGRDGSFLYSSNNFLEVSPFNRLSLTTATRRYGMELETAGGRKSDGWYYRASLTLLRAETRQTNDEWAKDRYSADYITKLTLGREWAGEDKKSRARSYGLNLALIAHGGERHGEVVPSNIETPSVIRYFAPQDYSRGFINSTGTYFRPDLRLYKTKTRTKTTTTLALDLQNVAGIENVGNVYYDAFLERPNERLQLGLIPVLSYRVVWR